MKLSTRKFRAPLFGLALSLMSAAPLSVIAEPSALDERAAKLAKLGGIAAGFSEVSNGTATDELIAAKFSGFDDKVMAAVNLWAKDPELAEAPPAFRRFLLFDYLTQGTDVIAAASNPPELLINADASVDTVFSDLPDVQAWAHGKMKAVVDTPETAQFGDYFVGVYPMIPPEEKAAGCVACHASAEVGRPYPAGQKVLGYTFIAIPK